MNEPRTLQEAIRLYSDEKTCIGIVAAERWPDGKPVCPHCHHKDQHYWLETQKRWKCTKCRQQFSVKVGTIFAESPIPLSKWLPVMWMICNCKNGVSSWEIHRDIGVTQKSAWFMLHRIRMAIRQNPRSRMGGNSNEVEVDETFIGGKVKNMHHDRRVRFAANSGHTGGFTGKSVVQGFLDRDRGKVRAALIPDTKGYTLNVGVRKNVRADSMVYTDNHPGYDTLGMHFAHEVVDHARRYVEGRVHTNGIENFWSLLKRSLAGTYVAVEPFHLERYVDEQVFRFNNRATKDRKVSDLDRFKLALSQISDKRLTYAELTGKAGAAAAF